MKYAIRTDTGEIDKDVTCLMNLVDQVRDRIDFEDRDENYKPTFSDNEIVGALSFALGNFNITPEFTHLNFGDVQSNKLLIEILVLGAGIYLDGGSDLDRIMKSEKYNKMFERYQNIVKYVKKNFLELVDFGQKMEELNLEIVEQINYCFSKFETKIKIFSDNYKFKSLLKYDKFIKTIHPDRKPKYDINMYKRYHRYTNGYFDPNEMEICILFPDLNKMQQLLFTILHEYGHYIAYKNNEYLNFLLSSEIFLKERRYGCGGFASDIIFQDEISAWENAECWAHKHKIPLNNEYIDIKYYSLSTYNKEKTIKYFQNINK